MLTLEKPIILSAIVSRNMHQFEAKKSRCQSSFWKTYIYTHLRQHNQFLSTMILRNIDTYTYWEKYIAFSLLSFRKTYIHARSGKIISHSLCHHFEKHSPLPRCLFAPSLRSSCIRSCLVGRVALYDVEIRMYTCIYMYMCLCE